MVYTEVFPEMEKEIIIKAAKDAIFIQDACNLSGVVHSWSRILTEVIWPWARELGKGTEWVNTHPINVMFSNKVASLTRSETFRTFDRAYEKCMELSAGNLDCLTEQ